MAGLSEADLVQRMVGRAVNDLEHRPRRTAGPVVMRVDGIGRGTAVQDVSLALRAGEVFGIAGLVGSGRTELLRLLFGADRADRGSVTLAAGSTVSGGAAERTHVRGFRSPLAAIAAGIGLVSEDRKSQGLLLSQPIRVNATLSDLSAVSRAGWLRRAHESTVVQGLHPHAAGALPRAGAARGAAVGRQPAEGGVRAMAAPRRPRAAAGRAHARRGRGRARRPVRRARPHGRRRPSPAHGVVRPARADGHGRPHRRDERRPPGCRVRARRVDRAVAAGRRFLRSRRPPARRRRRFRIPLSPASA